MMESLLAYSGLSTKIRAMKGRLISQNEFQEMCMLESVEAAADYLKRHPEYEDLFKDLEEGQLHRSNLEELLILSLYRDFERLYRFSDVSQRKFLDLYFLHFEIAMVKRCLRAVLGHQEAEVNLALFQDFFQRHSRLSLADLLASANLHEFVLHLKGSAFESMADQVKKVEDLTVFDCEMKLDLIYFRTIWEKMGKLFSKAEQKMLTETFGAKLDLLNIQWIYRSKKYYHLDATDIYALLIPVHHRLKGPQIKSLVESQTLEEFYTVLQDTYYGSSCLSSFKPPNPEQLYRVVLNKLHAKALRKHPYSIAALNSYFYLKEEEIRKIITVIESIRYGIDGNEILSHIKEE